MATGYKKGKHFLLLATLFVLVAASTGHEESEVYDIVDNLEYSIQIQSTTTDSPTKSSETIALRKAEKAFQSCTSLWGVEYGMPCDPDNEYNAYVKYGIDKGDDKALAKEITAEDFLEAMRGECFGFANCQRNPGVTGAKRFTCKCKKMCKKMKGRKDGTNNCDLEAKALQEAFVALNSSTNTYQYSGYLMILLLSGYMLAAYGDL